MAASMAGTLNLNSNDGTPRVSLKFHAEHQLVSYQHGVGYRRSPGLPPFPRSASVCRIRMPLWSASWRSGWLTGCLEGRFTQGVNLLLFW